MVRWDSPFVLATAGTFALHVILLVAADAVAITHPLHLDPPAPHVQMIDVRIQRPAAVVHHEEPKPAPRPAPTAVQATAVHRVTHAAVAQPVAAVQAPAEPSATAEVPPGGDDGPVVAMPDVAPAATGVAVAKRPGTGTGTGTGTGSGTGTGTGTGTGSGDGPVSVATIKHQAMPRADYGYVLSKDYPAEAKRLGIEGVLQVRIVVDATGKVTSATLLDHLGHGLDELALAQARRFEFTPATGGDDRPVASVVVWTFRMTPPK